MTDGLKLFITYKLAGKVIELYNASSTNGKESETAVETYRRFLLDEKVIQAWGYKGIDGELLPLELESFEQMDLDDLRDLNTAVLAKINPINVKKK